MKKAIALLLAAMVSAAALTGCMGLPEEAVPTDDIGEGSSDLSQLEFPTEAPAATEAPRLSEVTVRPAEWCDIQWEPYSSKYITLNIPSGWQVKWQGDAHALEWMATNPEGTIGIYNLDHNYAAKDASMQQTLGFSMTLNNGTVQEYFETMYADITDYFNVQSSCVPANKDIIQAARPYTAIRDDQSLYATFKDNTVGEGEGLYSAVIMDSPDHIIRGQNYGNWEINCTVTQWAPLGQFVNWSPVLATIAQSFSYTDTYIQEWMAIAQTNNQPSNSVSDTDPVMEAFEERSKSDDIIREKRSDMLGEYERVYDNERGEIYRAYNGFLDDMGDQTRYTPISDPQYGDGYVGWIDKPD